MGVKEKYGGLNFTLRENCYEVSAGDDYDEIKIEIPPSYNGLPVKKIADCAFCANTCIKQIYFPQSIVEIGQKAFENCKSLESVYINEGLKTIGAKAFSGCTALTYATLPRGLTHIGKNAFRDCPFVENLVCADIDDNADVVFDKSEDGSFAIARMKLSRPFEIKIPPIYCNAPVNRINDEAFLGCNGLLRIYLPNCLKTIGNRAFYDCKSLETISYDGTMQEWYNINKLENWDYGTNSYTVSCIDGKIIKY